MMMLGVAVGVALATSCLFHRALGWNPGGRLAALAALSLVVVFSPLLVPGEARFVRFLAALFAIVQAVKLYDLHLGAARGRRPDFATTSLFLINLTTVVERKLGAEPRPTRSENWTRLGTSLVRTVPGAALWIVAWHFIDWRPVPFLVEHGVKALAFGMTIFPGGAAGAALWRVLGNPAREPMDHPFEARSPADFWRRYNRIGGQFFHEDVFKPLGGPKCPILGTIATFGVSGALHEYLFVMAAGRFQGYQMAFFLIQGVACALTLRLRARGWRRALGVALTLAFNLATVRLFFASFDEITPFYAMR